MPRLACVLAVVISIFGVFLPTVAVAQLAPPAAQAEKLEQLVRECLACIRTGDTKAAMEHANAAVSLAPDDPQPRLLRGRLCSSLRLAAEAVVDFDKLIQLEPKVAGFYDERGSERFKLGKMNESIADFDAAVKLEPAREASHWKRGISYYYAGRYADGRKQFEGYQNFDSNDVENAVWRFLCMARQEGEGFAAAQASILKIGQDDRVPMRQVYALFAGKAKPEEVLEAATAGDPPPGVKHNRLFYAHQYLGLYHEAKGDAAAALTHMKKAVDHEIAHYMWDVAKVHVALRTAKPEKP
jgi:lipoprotein NlpI